MNKGKNNSVKFRVYALILGETLPEGELMGCKIQKISFSEQKKRGFKPIQSKFSTNLDPDFHKTYATYLPYMDPMKIVSEYVAIYDSEEDKPGAALGDTVRAIDKLCRFLSIACFEDVKRKFGRHIGAFQPYIYQLCKIYKLDSKSREANVEYELKSGFVYLPNRPELKAWRSENTQEFLEEISSFQDEVLQRALKYLYRSSIGFFLRDSKEKVALDHIKSIEIILNDLSNKDDFKDRLDEAGKKLELTNEEKKRIFDFWGDRSKYGDVAHPTEYDNTERYPNQFPIPSNVDYSGGGFESVAANVCLKYFYYKKSFVVIEIEEPDEHRGKENTFGGIYRLWPEKNGASLYFLTSEKDKTKLKKLVKTEFSKRFKVNEGDIVDFIIGKGKKTVTLRLKSEI